MSQLLINRSPDLKRLRDEGYHLEIKSGYLLLRDVPYVNASREIKRGTLVSKLTLAGDITAKPDTHVIYFQGDHPCDKNGGLIAKIQHGSNPNQKLAEGITVDHSFSAKPQPSGKYEDYYTKLTTYAAILSGPAQAIDSLVTAMTFPVIEANDAESVFEYIDTAASRADINLATAKLEKIGKIAIVGLGGTGSYVLDLVAKTPVKEIHLFEGDTFFQHNAFRSPGAPSIEELRAQLSKVAYFQRAYSRMRRGLIGHEGFVDSRNVDQLRGMDFVFLCIDNGGAKRLVVEKLEEFGISFVDVGMGVYLKEASLGGILRITCSTPQMRDHVRQRGRIPFFDDDADNEYARNIQIADLNALNAALAVIRWKKLCGFYFDFEHEHNSAYTIDGNSLINEDRP